MTKIRSKDNTAINTADLEKERHKLLVNKSNPERLKEITEKLDYIYFGIIKK